VTHYHLPPGETTPVAEKAVVARAAAGRAEEGVKDPAAVAVVPAAAAVARGPAAVVVLAAVAVVAAAEALVAPVAVLAAAVVEEVGVPVAAADPADPADPVVAAAAPPEVLAAGVVVVKGAVAAAVGKVRAVVRVEAEGKVVATAGGPVAEAIGSFQTAGGRRVRPPAFLCRTSTQPLILEQTRLDPSEAGPTRRANCAAGCLL